MQIILEPDEAWSLMMVIASYSIDHGNVSQDGKQAIRNWRKDRSVGTAEMSDLTVAMNEALGSFLDEKMTRQIRRKGRYISTKGN